jgi:membrane peptidoglycan carboxypeptidase
MGQDKKHFGVGKAFAAYVAFSVLAGVLVTAAITPALGVTSQTAQAGIGVFNNLPDYLVIGTESQQNIIYAIRGGKNVPIATIFNQNRQEVGWDAVSPYLKDAAVDGEDRRFYTHGGVDFPSVARAAIGNLTSSSITSGSSTIDMQLVKNILLQQSLQITNDAARKKAYTAAIDDTLQRKLKEMKLSIGLDKKYTKQQILLAYLNITGFGGNYYGVQSGAQRYFSVDAKDVTVAQAASLVAIVQQPNLQNLSDPKLYAANKVRRDQILNDMYALKHITKAQFDAHRCRGETELYRQRLPLRKRCPVCLRLREPPHAFTHFFGKHRKNSRCCLGKWRIQGLHEHRSRPARCRASPNQQVGSGR